MMDLKTFVYQPILDALELKKGTDNVLSWKSKGVFNSKLKLLYPAFLHSIKVSEYRIEIKFDKYPLAIPQNNYLTKIVNVYLSMIEMFGQEIFLTISNLRIAYLKQLI